ncbi:MAG: hypothetical protein K2N94_05125, partial [Lachnospiraceae bacterium]|nr:hypothetical protein [Lachnospiraceae bacterium]
KPLIWPGPDAPMQQIATAACDEYPVMYAKTAQRAAEATICIRFCDAEVELISETEDMAAVRHKSSGVRFDVPKKYLYRRGETRMCSDYTNAELGVQEGEALKLILQTSAGAIVKQDGKLGWYRGELCASGIPG